RPERRQRDDEERDLVLQLLHLHRQEVRDGKAEDEAGGDSDQGRQEAPPHVLPVGVVQAERVQQGAVVVQRPTARVEAGVGARPEADEHDEDERRDEEEAEPDEARQAPQKRYPAAALAAAAASLAQRLL